MPNIYVAPKKEVIQPRRKKPRKKIRHLARSLAKMGVKLGTYPFGAFVALPEKVSFENQEKEEEIVLLLRRHWSTNISWFLLAVLMIFAPIILKVLPMISFLPTRFQIIAVVMWYLLTLGLIFEKFLSWFFNVYLITDERVVDVDFYSLTYREISQAKIDKIQDITTKTGGLLKTIFNYGDVFVQTAGRTLQIEFESVPQPAKVVQVLNKLMAQEEQEKVEGRIR